MAVDINAARSSTGSGRLGLGWHARRWPLPRRLQEPHLDPPALGVRDKCPADSAARDTLAREFGYWWN